jgi:4-methylaminobutanoate oxidase (formaldehyde-forming)
MAAGLSLNGFGGAGGIGKTIAEWITGGETEWDVHGYRGWRFGAAYGHPDALEAAGRETYRYYYRLRYPLDTAEWGRPGRLSPVHVRTQDLGAVYGTKNGWERPDYFRPGQPSRRAGADQRGYGFTRPPELERLAAEHTAFRERVGIIDMTSFGKIEVEGPAAAALLERVCVNRVDRPAGSVVYTQWCDRRGGIVADVTVTRLAEERFRVVTGAGVVDSDLGWLRLHRRDGEQVSLRECSAETAVIGMWGPRARDVLQAVTADDVSAAGLPFRRAHTIAVGAAPVLAQRITYVGELGFELYVAPEWAVQVWDALWAAGRPHGIEPGGYRVLESLRMEKGYRYMGTDISAGDTPYEAGLGFCVALDKGEFVGRDALAAASARPLERGLRTLVVGGEDYLPLYGGEAVRLGGETAGRVRSCAYGFTVRRNIAYAYLPPAATEGTELEVEVLGEPVVARVAADVLYDPSHARVRG